MTPTQSKGRRAHTLNLISESGLYKLITRSDKPEASPSGDKHFQEWVTRDVLTSVRLTTIRKTGSYSPTDGVWFSPLRLGGGAANL